MMFWWQAPTIVVEPAELKDSADLAELHAASFHRGWSADEIEALLADEAVFAFAARRASPLGTRRPVGFVMIRVAGDEAEVLTLAVAARQQRRGLGRRLMDEAMRRLYHDRVAALFLEVDESNRAARALYARIGFKIVGRRPNYYGGSGKTRSAVVMKVDV